MKNSWQNGLTGKGIYLLLSLKMLSLIFGTDVVEGKNQFLLGFLISTHALGHTGVQIAILGNSFQF